MSILSRMRMILPLLVGFASGSQLNAGFDSSISDVRTKYQQWLAGEPTDPSELFSADFLATLRRVDGERLTTVFETVHNSVIDKFTSAADKEEQLWQYQLNKQASMACVLEEMKTTQVKAYGRRIESFMGLSGE